MRFFSNKIRRNIVKIPTHHPCSCSRAFLLKWRTPLFSDIIRCNFYPVSFVFGPRPPVYSEVSPRGYNTPQVLVTVSGQNLEILTLFEPKIKFSLNSVKTVNVFHRFLMSPPGYGSSIFNPCDRPPKIIVHCCNI